MHNQKYFDELSLSNTCLTVANDDMPSIIEN